MTTRFADHLLDGAHASRPAATAVPVGTLYACSDHALIYQSDGTAWSTWATLGAPAYTDEQVRDVMGVALVAGSNVTITPNDAADTITIAAAGATGPTLKYKAADESVASTTLQNDDHLFFTIGANEVWSVVWHLYLSNAAATADFKAMPGVPAGATERHGIIGGASTATGTEGSGHFQSHGSAALLVGVQAASNSDSYAILSATVENGATAGTVNLQWAQFTADATNATTLKRGSFMVAHRMA